MLSETRNTKPGDAGVVGPSTLAFLFWDNAFLIALSALLGVTLALAYLQWTPSVYSAWARLEVATNENVLPADFQHQAAEDVGSAPLLKTVEQTIASNSVLARVVAVNHLADDPEFAAGDADLSEGALIERLRSHIAVNLVRGTRLISIEVSAASPEKAQRWLQSLLDSFYSQGRDNSRRQTSSTRQFLVAEADRLAQNLHDSEIRLQQYREKYDAMAIAERQNLVIEQLRHLHAQLSDARNVRLTLESEQAQVQKALAGGTNELLNLQGIASRPEVAELRRKLDVSNNQVAAYAIPYGENHPVLQQARRQRDDTAAALADSVKLVAESILRNYQAAKTTEDLLQEELARQEKIAVELDRVAIPYHALERELQSDTALHAQVQARLKESDVVQNLMSGQNFSDSYVHLIDAPYASSVPVRPVWHLLLAAGLVGGGVVGVVLAALRCAFDDSVPSVDAAEACLGVATLAVVPRSRHMKFRHGRLFPAASGESDAEAFRLLRTTLALRESTTPSRTMLFTSACPGEGKTCCSINYAVAVARSGLRTLLIDGDLRRPKLRTAFERHGNKTSLVDCLLDPDRLASAIETTSQKNLFLLASPYGTPRAAELLAGDNLRLVLEKCAELFDRIVIDTAPVAVVSDALCFARYVPTICLVVRAGHTPRRLVRRARTLITEVAGRPIAGVVLNQIRRDRAATYGYYLASRYSTLSSASASG